MDEIIREIIKIDQEASRKLEDAQRVKDEVLKKQMIEENQELRHKMRERAQMHLDKVKETEQKHADERIAEINSKKNNELEILKKTYEEHHQGWEEDLFNRVLGR